MPALYNGPTPEIRQTWMIDNKEKGPSMTRVDGRVSEYKSYTWVRKTMVV